MKYLAEKILSGNAITGIEINTAYSYEALMDKLEDLELNAIADAREGQPVIKVELDAL